MADNLEQIANDLKQSSLKLQEIRERYDGALDILNTQNAQIIENLNNKKTEALGEIESVKDTATTQITELQTTALSSIDESKNTSINEVISKKDEALTQIEEAKTEQGEKIAKLETDLNLKAKLLTQNIEFTVGSGEESDTHFNTLEKAISEALKYSKQNNLMITIKLTEDLTLTKMLNFIYCDCRNIMIDGQGYTIRKENNGIYDTAFNFNNCVAPKLNNITISNPNTENKIGSAITVSDTAIFNNRNCSFKIDGFNSGVCINNMALVNLLNESSSETKISNCNYGFYSWSTSFTSCQKIKFENNKTAINVNGGAFVNCNLADFENNTSNCNIAFNTVTPNGICFKN
ncbi:GumC domain-containing protein [Campylobacter estrildidarum]|uniref:Right handed beta helix domain-containing protein n=1 Tax=Campylobacter estrildidarum TaxID=2510189 RepID=A0A4V6DXA4_9BACT|nr:hypothetical protein [Campylobacter estrildidarum]TKX30492.1 hypothetical protein CQA69_06340 [Campylobacter estrildidarum]